MKLFILLITILITSCATRVEREYERVQTDQYYRDSGVSRYLLPLIPEWSNSSFEGNCLRSTQSRNLNIRNLMDSFSVDQERALQIQLAFNRTYNKNAADMERSPTLKEVEQIFFEANDFVTATGGYFKRPKYKRVNIIWFDTYRDNIQKLKKLMTTKAMFAGRPVFVSLCNLESEMKDLMAKSKINSEGAFFIDYHFISKYDRKGDLGARERIYLKDLLEVSVKDIRVYSNKEKPKFIIGKYRFIKY